MAFAISFPYSSIFSEVAGLMPLGNQVVSKDNKLDYSLLFRNTA
jgi:hypothetical protein